MQAMNDVCSRYEYMALLSWLQGRNVLERSMFRFTAECVNASTQVKVILPWNLNLRIKDCAVLETRRWEYERKKYQCRDYMRKDNLPNVHLPWNR